MTILLLYLIASFATAANSLKAQLILLDYEPLLFQLDFSEPVQRPAFQLLYNNIEDIPYTFQTQELTSDTYIIQADISNLQSLSTLQQYDLMFNSPLTIGSGSLQVGSYTIHAIKNPVQLDFPPALGITILITAYLLNMITEIGKLSMEFLHVYVLYMFQSGMTSALFRKFFQGLLMIPPRQILEDQIYDQRSYILLCLALPLSILWVLALIGYICKKCCPKQRSIFQNIVYEEMVFNFFLKACHIFCFNLLFNSIQFILLLNDGVLSYIESIKTVGITLIYFNLLTLIAILYLFIYILNPKPQQTEQHWQKYLNSQNFQSFRMLHQRLHLKPWYKRNYEVFKKIKYLLIITTYFWSNFFQYFALVYEFGHIFFTFTVRPFREEFYLNVKVICRLLFFTEYLFIVLINLYFSMGSITIRFSSARSLILARTYLFLIIMLGLFVGVIFQIFFKCSNLNYQIKLVRQQNMFKLQFVQKARTDSDSKGRKTKNSDHAWSDKKSKSSSKPVDSISDFSMIPERRMSKIIKTKIKEEEKEEKIHKSPKQVEQTNLKKESSKQNDSLVSKNYSSSSSHRHKWKKQSLLEGMIKKN